MKYLRISYRLSALVLLSLMGLVLMAIYSPRSSKKHQPLTQKQKKIRAWWLKKVVSIVGIKLTVKGSRHNEHALWVSNHISWLDIPIIGSEGAAFLSKAEVRKWPVIGWLGEKGGTVFIQRGGKNASQIASQKIAETIQGGDNILIFPEATTSDGKTLKRFHARIFAPAIDYHLPVQPIAIRYLNEQGELHPKVVWGDESFMRNLMGILGETGIFAEVTFCPIVEGHQFNERKRIAEYTEDQVGQAFYSQAVTDQTR